MISRDTIDEVHKLPILEVVTRFYRDQLKSTGSTFRGRSPWTEEKTPSFYVVPRKNIFKDFSSGYGGSAINFVMLHENLHYVDAIKAICKEFNLPVTYEENGADPEENDFIDKLYAVNRAAARRYAEQLLSMDGRHPHFHRVANEIIRRQFTDETILQWQIGYAPDTWNFLSHILTEKGYHRHGVELGLIKTKEGRTYDVLRHRIVFPIVDERGQIVAFGGRYLPGAIHFNEDPTDRPPKYLNTSESKIYNKSRTLYGLYYAVHAIQKMGYARLVEGYTDVISFHQAGFCNTVGSCGTALTEDQVKLLSRYTKKVVLIFDPDAAGIRAADRAIDLFLAAGFELQICPLPEGKDPDEFVRMDPEEFAQIFNQNQ